LGSLRKLAFGSSFVAASRSFASQTTVKLFIDTLVALAFDPIPDYSFDFPKSTPSGSTKDAEVRRGPDYMAGALRTLLLSFIWGSSRMLELL